MSTFGDRLKKLRLEKGNPRQEDVALAIGYARATYANWEIDRGEADHTALRALAKYYNCSIDYLLGVSDTPRPERPLPIEDDDDELDIVIAANKDGDYGKEPSPQLKAIIKRILKEELAKRKK